MPKINFIFIAVCYLSIILLAGYQNLSIESQAIISAIFVLVVGIPHGAVDHVLHNGAENKFSVIFLSKYIGLMIVVLATWLIAPIFALSTFLVVSAYHFGEAQFSDLNLPTDYWTHFIRFSWGSIILLLLFVLNHEELVTLFSRFEDTRALGVLFELKLLVGLLLLSILGLIVSIYVLNFENYLSNDRLAHEIYVLGLITFTYYVVPFLIGFTLFFCILHSLKVLQQEFNHLKETYKLSSFLHFVKVLAPFTLISVVGSTGLGLLIFSGRIPISLLLFSLIAISMITFPHSVVMNKFYNRRTSTST